MQYRPEIDGLRALAVMPVIFFHAGFDLFKGGFVGVDVFFVISGFLITSIIIRDLELGRFSLAHFYERRARRILPALFCVMLACLPFAYLWLMPDAMKLFSQSIIATTGFVSNIFFWRQTGYFGPTGELSPLLHTWSLAVEEQYYIFFPVFLMLCWGIGKRKILSVLSVIFLISLCLSQWAVEKYPSGNFFLLPSRFWELLVGALLAFYMLRRESFKLSPWSQFLSLSGLCLVGYSIFVFDSTTPFPSFYALVPTLGTALIILCAQRGTLSYKILSFQPFVFLGLISYSAYLWHQPVFALARHRSLQELSTPILLRLSALSLVLAFLSWKFVEQPFRDKNFLTRKKVFGLSLAGLVGFALIGYLGQSQQGLKDRVSPDIYAIDVQTRNWTDKNPCTFNTIASKEKLAACFSPGNTVYLIGDSHAQSLTKEFRVMLEARGYNFIAWTANACFPIKGLSRLPEGRYKACEQFKQALYEQLEHAPAPTIMSTRWRLNLEGSRYDNHEGGKEAGPTGQVFVLSDYKADPYSHVFYQLSELAQTVPLILIDQIPEAGWDVPDLMMKRRHFKKKGQPVEPVSTAYGLYKQENERVNRLLRGLTPQAKLIETAPLICDDVAGRCVNEIGSEPLYIDDDHASQKLSNMLAREMLNALPAPLQ